MKAFRVAAALLALSMIPATVWSQGSGQGSGSSSATPPPPDDPADEEAGSGSGSAQPALVAPPLPAQRKQWVGEQAGRALASHPTLAGARIGIAITDLATGESLYTSNADAKLNLASNTKLLTSVAALSTLGNGFRWRTAVLVDKLPDDAGTIVGDIYLRGRGDPLLSAQHLSDLAADLAARGVRRIDGRIVLDTSYFDGVTEPPHFEEQPKELSGFRAPVASLGVARSAVTVKVTANYGGGVDYAIEPDAGDYVTLVKREAVTVPTGRSRIRVASRPGVRPPNAKMELEVTGTIRLGDGTWESRRRVDDPARFAGEVFRAALLAKGITIRQRALGNGTAPLTAKQLAVHDSVPLPDILRFMNKASDNYVAESVLKTLGAETRTTPGPATWADGTAAVTAALAKVGLPAGSYRADNGSGLFASTDVSAAQMVTLLVGAHGNYRIGPDLVQSLPIGGADGTLARRWVGRPAQGRVRAKTGTLDKVVTLAGYVAVEGNKTVAFAVLLNDVPAGQRSHARALADGIVDVIAAYLGGT